MVHVVKIIKYKQRRVAFELGGKKYNARFEGDSAQAREVLKPGVEYPLALTVDAEGKVDYSDDFKASFRVAKAAEDGDRVAVNGRTWDSISHEAVALETDPSVALRLREPQFATDFRGGSWLVAQGVLCATLPEDHHD
ncbi:MAG: hypothetical protein IT462_17620 [Planctomycetes bacterium]|nr:hypothetical protein [Planctomycetota bacterium]